MKLSFKAQLKDAKERIVEGYATTESWDRQGEKLPLEVAKKAFEGFVKSPKICKLHGREEFGTANPCGCGGVGELTEYTADDKGIMIAVKITDNAAWDKVVKGEYNGFSIGGYSRANDGVITDFELVEISLVGIPVNGDCVFLTAKGGIKMDEESKALLKLIVENQKLMLAELAKANAAESAEPPEAADMAAKGGAMNAEFAAIKATMEAQCAEIAGMKELLTRLENTPAFAAKGAAFDAGKDADKTSERKVSEVPYAELLTMTVEQRSKLINDLT